MPPRRVVTGRSQQPRQRFAEELRLLRAQSGDSLRHLGEVLGWDWSLFGKMESGETIGGPEVVQALDQHYRTPGLLLALWELALADPSRFYEQYRRYMALEAEAIGLWHYAVSAPPGLLQTDGYAREALVAGGVTGEELTQQVEARVGRHAVLLRRDPPHFRAVLSEAVLRTPLRDRQAWRAQLEHLLSEAERPHVTLQVLPLSAGPHGLMSTPVMVLRLPDGRTAAYSENDVRGELVEETIRVEQVLRWYDAMRDMALSPEESQQFIRRMVEEAQCDPAT